MSTDTIKHVIQYRTMIKAMTYLEDNPEENIPKLMDLIDRISSEGWFTGQRDAFRKAIEEKNNWYDLILRVYEIDAGIRKRSLQNFIINATLNGGVLQKTLSEEYNCNIPWAILFDPTAACNMKCKGCWASKYGNHMNLKYDVMDSIVNQGKHLGTYIYLFTGGEPLLRKKDIIRLCEEHPDCMFMAFTNGTLIDDDFCEEMLRLKNLLVAISMEGFEQANDARRGKGTYQKIRDKMEMMKEYRIPFGVSTCYTSQNIDDVSSDEYYEMMIESGAFFVWFFHYMPVGSDADTGLLPNPAQREKMYANIQKYRRTKPIFTIDFQNDGKYAGGCIAGGRKYIHINANGDIEPCAFIHYSDCNIHETSLLDAYRKPLFMAYHDRQPFNENMFKPCPMLENPECIEDIIRNTDAINTDTVHPETIEQLCSKTKPYAKAWNDTAERLWTEIFEKKE
ncbi:MAG: radical SAM protein [Firmicutes bacterium]|nr:radical SAM protein [Bacillota bacterium]